MAGNEKILEKIPRGLENSFNEKLIREEIKSRHRADYKFLKTVFQAPRNFFPKFSGKDQKLKMEVILCIIFGPASTGLPLRLISSGHHRFIVFDDSDLFCDQ